MLKDPVLAEDTELVGKKKKTTTKQVDWDCGPQYQLQGLSNTHKVLASILNAPQKLSMLPSAVCNPSTGEHQTGESRVKTIL